MKKTAIMTDTNSGITPEVAKENGIFLLKMPFAVNGKEYIEYGEMSYGEFFEVLDSGAEVSTSQPSPAALTDMWDEILKTYESVVYFPMSSGLSGTCETARALASDYDGRVLVVDNKRISVTLYTSVFNAVKQANDGLSAEKIADYAEKDAGEQSIYVSVNTLEHLKKSGRVTAAGAAIGTLLGIKPVLQIQGGKLDAYKKVRGMKAAIEAMLDGIENDRNTRFAGKRITVRAAYSGDIEVGKEWQAQVSERFPDLEIGLDALPISISCHVGGGALGIGISVVL
ncbi:MAG: DegV family protein [Acutalibacteraceae bacterium]